MSLARMSTLYYFDFKKYIRKVLYLINLLNNAPEDGSNLTD